MVPTLTIPYRTEVNLGSLQANIKILQDVIRDFIVSDVCTLNSDYILTDILSNRERGISHGFEGF